MSHAPHIAVVGGGITGLSAAATAARAGARVTLLEAGERLGGKIRSERTDGHAVDVGAESLVANMPTTQELCRELALEDDAVYALSGDSAVLARGRLRALPSGILSGLPDGPGPVLRSGILPLGALARGALDLVLPGAPVAGDAAVGEVVGRRLGRAVVDRLVDPLLGTIYAADSERLSMRLCAPALGAIAAEHRSLILGMRTRRGPSPPRPSFFSFEDGMQTLVDALGERLGEGTEVRRGAAVRELALDEPGGGDSDDGGYRLAIQGAPEPLHADGVLVATPAPEAATLLAALRPDAAAELRAIAYSPTVVVVLRWPGGALSPPPYAGVLIPRDEPWLLGACTWLSNKWPHLQRTGDVWLRCSVARAAAEEALAMDDDQLVARLVDDLRDIAAPTSAPTYAAVTRWERALPVYEPGHAERVARIRTALDGLPGVVVAGAAYDGIGVPSCAASGRRAAQELLSALEHGRAGHVATP